MDERPTAELKVSRIPTVQLPEPRPVAVASSSGPIPKVETGGAYSLTLKKPRASSQNEASSESPMTAEILETATGFIRVSVGGHVVKLRISDARGFAEAILRATK